MKTLGRIGEIVERMGLKREWVEVVKKIKFYLVLVSRQIFGFSKAWEPEEEKNVDNQDNFSFLVLWNMHGMLSN